MVKERQHGTLAMRRRGVCQSNPCEPCRLVGIRYAKRQVHAQVTGQTALVDAEPARLYIKQLLADGMTVFQIQETSGVNRTSIRVIIGDFPGRKQSVRIRPATAAALLAVTLNLGVPVGTATVPSIGTRRRIQALQAIGYGTRDLALRLGSSPNSSLMIARADRVLASTARSVAALYEELKDTPGPSNRTARQALTKGYLPPIWWDGDIDDPTVQPEGLRTYSDRGVLLDDVTAPRASRIKSMLARDMSRQEIADHLGIHVRYVNRDIRMSKAARLAPARDTKQDIDEVAVERALLGWTVQLNRAEHVEAIRRMHEQGLSDKEIGGRLHITGAAVFKVRQRNLTEGTTQ